MFLWLLLLFVTMPLVELALLMRVAQTINVGPTIALVIVTGALGAALARRQGLRTWARVQGDLAAGRMPASEIVDAMLILVAGLVLITPGIITDALGFLLLIPPARRWLKRRVADHLRSQVTIVRTEAPLRDDFVDVEVRDVHDTANSELP